MSVTVLTLGGSGVAVWDGSSAPNTAGSSGGSRGAVSAGATGEQGEMGRSLSVGSPVCGKRSLLGALSLRYRSSATLPLAAGSSSSRRFCLWKKPSWGGAEVQTGY